jgi:hypothetical protein
MRVPLIAIVGDANKTKNPSLARQAAEEIGGELAQRGCRILVYSSSPDFIEMGGSGLPEIKGPAELRSVEVRYPPELDGRFPGEEPNDIRFVRTQQTGDWEASVYPSGPKFQQPFPLD